MVNETSEGVWTELIMFVGFVKVLPQCLLNEKHPSVFLLFSAKY
jgi:hypothetical protein